MNRLKISVFADLHYKQDMYAATVADLEAVMQRAVDEQVELVIHCGDFCNDYPHSPEILKPYLESALPVYGCYGNHELEAQNNSMAVVTPLLCNADVVWGTDDGKIGDGSSEIPDAIRQGHIAYVLNTSEIGSTTGTHDGHEIRKLATENNVTIFTSLDTVKVLLDVLDENTIRISTIDA